MVLMAKDKKPKGNDSGKHTTPRKGVNFPVDWLDVAKRVAAKERMPMMWLFIELLTERAEKLGITDLPAPPWGEDTPEGEGG